MKKTILKLCVEENGLDQSLSIDCEEDLDMQDALDVLRGMTQVLTEDGPDSPSDRMKANIHLMALALAAASASEEPFSVRQKADMFADFLIASRALVRVADIADQKEANRMYRQVVDELTEEYDAAPPTKPTDGHGGMSSIVMQNTNKYES